MPETETTQAERYPHLLNDGKGHVVPWVTRWTNEVVPAPLQTELTRDGVKVSYPDGRETREASGILWLREGIMRGGKPMWAQVNTYRQRAAMTKRRCQICGNKIPPGPINWLLDTTHLHERTGGVCTENPPTCDDCLEISLELCPHLKKAGHMIARVQAYEIWGVYGGAVQMTTEGLHQVPGASFRYSKVAAGEYEGISPTAIVAKQQVVLLTDFTLERNEGTP